MGTDIKSERHERILSIIRERIVETQEELLEALADEGIHVTQATVSRDIKELGLIKRPVGDGRYRYCVPHDLDRESSESRLRRFFEDSVVGIDASENLVVVKTLTGNAHAVAAAIDAVNWREILGTVAGDDTILIVARSREHVQDILEKLTKLRG